ncbi:hypothetical protein SAMN02745883_01753 [Caminicella sporogenes DSM 14501]|uniref:Uncharacterized protein n=1 Tax=Caminicella sporogenes DSM 14501 TaxID=1121266 RepID=A0A1M6RDH7_9FIRM|nr:hypothetical protein [Caminicella sporogenes]RKD25202.1 hypothetical protein BET04_03000 [Caminicella sporogenes]SHK30519.1 hypothetical protein SAMN02745883_01753 [Caminicella sporogenes DSM 14501]
MENKKKTGTISAGIKEVYECKVGLEALSRAGRNKNLHGIVHEVLYKDAQNLNPSNIIKGVKASLSKSSTAIRDDVVLMQAGKVIGRSQLKDTAKSISHTVKQVSSGKYQGTVLMGTKETVKAYNNEIAKLASKGVKVTQKMKSTGISSADTARIASKTIGGNLTSKVLTSAAKGSGAIGAAVSGGIEVICAGKDLLDGRIDGEEFASRVIKETAGGGLSAAAGGVAATAAATTAASILATTTAPVWAPAAIGVGAAVAVGSAVKGIWDAIWG